MYLSTDSKIERSEGMASVIEVSISLLLSDCNPREAPNLTCKTSCTNSTILHQCRGTKVRLGLYYKIILVCTCTYRSLSYFR